MLGTRNTRVRSAIAPLASSIDNRGGAEADQAAGGGCAVALSRTARGGRRTRWRRLAPGGSRTPHPGASLSQAPGAHNPSVSSNMNRVAVPLKR